MAEVGTALRAEAGIIFCLVFTFGVEAALRAEAGTAVRVEAVLVFTFGVDGGFIFSFCAEANLIFSGVFFGVFEASYVRHSSSRISIHVF